MDLKQLNEMARRRLVGFASTIGLELDEVEPGRSRGHCALRPELLNPYGFAHGGAINTVMDTLGGMAACGAVDPPRYMVTRSADVHYLRPVLGGMMKGRAEAVKAGKQVCLVRAEIFDEEDRLCAEGLIEYYYLNKNVE